MIMLVCIILLICLAGIIIWHIFHQRLLRRRAYIMREAIRNHDFNFRLPVDGLLGGERALQETLNMLGDTINQQLNMREVESWERLTRILTHEMMNSIAPISSISSSILARKEIKDSPLEDGIRAIYQTAQHMNNFVSSYRKMSQLESPNITPVNLYNTVNEITKIYPQTHIAFKLPQTLLVKADEGMLRQVLMNLIKNAIEANATRVIIELIENSSMDYDYVTVAVANNGAPIPAETRQVLFVPFFTTKRSGSGIGLSLSRRMMVQQGGTLDLADTSHFNLPTEFLLTLKTTPD